MPTLIRPPKEFKPLADRLRASLHLAFLTPTVRIHIVLGRGLNIWITADLNGEITLELGRFRSEPSEQEWTTVLKHWPYPAAATPRREEDHGWSYLKAVLEKPKQTKMF